MPGRAEHEQKLLFCVQEMRSGPKLALWRWSQIRNTPMVSCMEVWCNVLGKSGRSCILGVAPGGPDDGT